jgi:16S rRNA processing protein RimM
MNSVNKDQLLYFGKATRPHGLKGAMEAQLLNAQDSSLSNGVQVWLFPHNGKGSLPAHGEKFEVESIIFGHKVMLKLVGVSSRTELEQLLPCELYRPREELPELEEGEYYLSDLEGLNAVNPEGEVFGVIQSFYDNNAHDVVVVKLVGGGTMEIPFIEPFLIQIDLEQKLVQLRPVELI